MESLSVLSPRVLERLPRTLRRNALASSRLDSLNRWLGIVSSVGVIGGFVLVAGRLMWPTIEMIYPPEFTAAIDRELARELFEPWDSAAMRTFDEVRKLPPLASADPATPNSDTPNSEITQ